MIFARTVCLWLVLATPAAAQVDFAARKITLHVGFAAGQSADMALTGDAAEGAGQRLTAEPTYDTAGRFYATHLPRFLQGVPAMESLLTPGAASLVAASRIAASASRGAIDIAMLGPAALFAGVSGAGGGFNPSSLAWIGARQGDDDVCLAREGAPVASMQDALVKQSFAAALTPGSRSALYPRALNLLAGAKLKIISGYTSAFEVSRALETGEADVWCGWSVASLRLRHPGLLREGKVRLLVQFSRSPVDARLTIPLASEIAMPSENAQAMKALEGQTLFSGFALAVSSKTDSAIVQALRQGFAAMLRDPGVLAEAERLGIEINPVAGEAMQAEVDRLRDLAEPARGMLRQILRGP